MTDYYQHMLSIAHGDKYLIEELQSIIRIKTNVD